MHKILVIFIIALTIFSNTLKAEKTSKKSTVLNSVEDPAYELTSLYATITLESMGNIQVEVLSNAKKDKFFITPFLIPDWSEYKSEIDRIYKKMLEKSDKLSLDPVAIPLKIRLTDPKIRDEIIAKVREFIKREKLPHTISLEQLSTIPYVFFQISAKLGEADPTPIITIPNLSSLDKEINLVTQTKVKPVIYTKVLANIKEHEALYKNRQYENYLEGRIYTKGYNLSPTVAMIHMRNFMKSHAITKLTGDEKLETRSKVSNNSSGSVLSFNLGNISFGTGDKKTSLSSEKSRKRVVSREFMNQFVRNNAMQIGIDITGDPKVIEKELSRVVEFILSDAKLTTLSFEKDSNGQMMMGNDILGYMNLNKRQVQEVMSAKPSIQSKLKNNTASNLVHAKSGASSNAQGEHVKKTDSNSDKKTDNNNSDLSFDMTLENDISYTFNGEDWIPSKVDAYILNTATLSKSVDIKWSTNIRSTTAHGFVHGFIYPAAVLYEEQKEWDSLNKRLYSLSKDMSDVRKKSTLTLESSKK